MAVTSRDGRMPSSSAGISFTLRRRAGRTNAAYSTSRARFAATFAGRRACGYVLMTIHDTASTSSSAAGMPPWVMRPRRLAMANSGGRIRCSTTRAARSSCSASAARCQRMWSPSESSTAWPNPAATSRSSRVSMRQSTRAHSLAVRSADRRLFMESHSSTRARPGPVSTSVFTSASVRTRVRRGRRWEGWPHAAVAVWGSSSCAARVMAARFGTGLTRGPAARLTCGLTRRGFSTPVARAGGQVRPAGQYFGHAHHAPVRHPR